MENIEKTLTTCSSEGLGTHWGKRHLISPREEVLAGNNNSEAEYSAHRACGTPVPGMSCFSCYLWEREVGKGAPSSVKVVAGLHCYSATVMSNILVGTVPSLPWSIWFFSSETTQGRPFRRKVEREGYGYLDSKTISDGQSPVLTENSMAFSSSNSSEAGFSGLYPSPQSDYVQLHNTALGHGWVPLEMFSTFIGHLLAGT